MKKFLTFFLIFCAFLAVPVNAKDNKVIKCDFANLIKSSGVNADSISISFKDADSGKVVYSLNDKILMNPASIQKLLTTPAAIAVLGEDYEFKTQLLKRDDSSYVIKLNADPYLTTKELASLIKPISPETTQVYIDDSIIDNKIWGEGWQWDDDLNPLMPKFSSYNLDKNTVKLTIMPSENDEIPIIINSSKYPILIFNNVKTGNTTDIKMSRDNIVSLNSLTISGTVSRPTAIYIPVSNPRSYFNFELKKSLENNKVYLKNDYAITQVKPTDTLQNVITRGVYEVISDILKNSNNMASETLFKIAGGKYMENKSADIQSGTDTYGVKMFYDFCEKLNLDTSKVRIVDGSGVSKNNLVSADFVTEFLYKNKGNKTLAKLPSPGEGTLTMRLMPIKESLKAKTGTLSNVSSIAGYLTTRSGKKYVFCIIDNDTKLTNSEKKALEDYMIREVYLKG